MRRRKTNRNTSRCLASQVYTLKNSNIFPTIVVLLFLTIILSRLPSFFLRALARSTHHYKYVYLFISKLIWFLWYVLIYTVPRNPYIVSILLYRYCGSLALPFYPAYSNFFPILFGVTFTPDPIFVPHHVPHITIPIFMFFLHFFFFFFFFHFYNLLLFIPAFPLSFIDLPTIAFPRPGRCVNVPLSRGE